MSTRTRRRSAFLPTAVCALGFLLTISCESPNDDAGGQRPPEYSVCLVGRVLDKDGRGIPNAIATLASRQLSAVTNTDGEYRIVDSTSGVSVAAKAGAADSVLVERDGQLIATIDVQSYVGNLPDLFIVQRDIYGTIATTVRQFSRIEAVIAGGVIPAEQPKVVELWHNTATNGFSGYVYFVYTPQVANYTVYINVYGADSTLIGRSDTVRFSSLAGDVQVPEVDPRNALPSLVLVADSIASFGDTVRLVARASDPFDSVIACYSWSLAGGIWSACADSDTVLVAGTIAQSVVCSVRVADGDSNVVAALVRVRVDRFAPVADAGPDASGMAGDQVHLQGTGRDLVGRIVKYEWDIGGTGVFTESSTGGVTVTAPMSASAQVRCVFRVTDDDGNQDVDTVLVGATSGLMSFMVGYNDSDAGMDPNPGWLRWFGNDPWNMPGDRNGCWAQLQCVGSGASIVADYSDSIVYAYKLSAPEEAAYSNNDSAVSSFWSSWAGRDSIRMAPPSNTARWNSVIVDTLDATVGVKVAHGARGVYVMVTVVDDVWMGSQGDDFAQDIVRLWLDGNSPERLATCTDCLIGLYSSMFSYQSLDVCVQTGATWWSASASLGYFDDNAWSWTQISSSSGLWDKLGAEYEVVDLGPNRRAVEVLVPWSLLR